MTPIWEPSRDFCAQSSHIWFWGFWTLFLGLRFKLRYVVPFMLGIALLKEYTFDIFVECDTVEGSTWDMMFCTVGTLLGVWALFRPWAKLPPRPDPVKKMIPQSIVNGLWMTMIIKWVFTIVVIIVVIWIAITGSRED